jgi:SAM-dependent methyltransferase
MAIVTVRGLPEWVDPADLLDSGCWEAGEGELIGERTLPQATLLSERLRNQGLGGRRLEITVQPSPRRSLVRKARTEVARLRRKGESGFKNRAAKVDEAGKPFLTSERLAMAMARRARADTVIDACCGCGGNAVAFARLGIRVTAIDVDAERLGMARHNAHVYGVQDRIDFVHGDARALLGGLHADLVFLDPPWGEVDRIWCREVPLLDDLIAASAGFGRVWAKVPASFAPPPDGFAVEPWFGMGEGDRRVIKFLLLSR